MQSEAGRLVSAHEALLSVSYAGAAVTKYHKLDGLEQQVFIVSQF